MTPRPSIGVIGAGKVGQTVARLLAQAGYEITAVHSRSASHAAALAMQVNADAADSSAAVLESAELTLLTVPDDVIVDLAQMLANGDLNGKGVVHTSGAHDATSLAPLAECGAAVGSLHPIYPFADVESAVQGLPGATFAVEAENTWLMACLGDMVDAVNGTILKLKTADKATYHAALVIASNYTVVLYDVARRLLMGISNNDDAIRKALNGLLAGTVRNIAQRGPADALTGPLVRGDVGTIKAHLDTLTQLDPHIAALYRDLARLALPMLTSPPDSLGELLEEVSDETDNP